MQHFAAKTINKKEEENKMPNGGAYTPSEKQDVVVQESIVKEVSEPFLDSKPEIIEPKIIENKMEEIKNIENDIEQKIIEPVTEDIQEVEQEVKKWWGQSVFSNKRERFGLIFIIIGILFVSFVSVSHLISYFSVGNTYLESIFCAIAFEILLLGSIAGLVLLPKIKNWAISLSIFFLYSLQVIANMYASYDIINVKGAQHFFEFFGLSFSEITGKRIGAILLGGILPSTTFLFAQLIKPYFGTKENSK